MNPNPEICNVRTKKIVLTGGPGTGKTSIIQLLEARNYTILPEISREIILKAQKDGIDQLFLEQPLLFSELLLEGRIEQYKEAEKTQTDYIFIDRGIPDVVAYMDYFKSNYPAIFRDACKQYPYDGIFVLPPWERIYRRDNERYESFEQACEIHNYLLDSYTRSGYRPTEVPLGTLEERASFILEHLP